MDDSRWTNYCPFRATHDIAPGTWYCPFSATRVYTPRPTASMEGATPSTALKGRYQVLVIVANSQNCELRNHDIAETHQHEIMKSRNRVRNFVHFFVSSGVCYTMRSDTLLAREWKQAASRTAVVVPGAREPWGLDPRRHCTERGTA